MKQIILWAIFVSLSVADANKITQNMEKYGAKALYHMAIKEYDLALLYAKKSCSLGQSESCVNTAYIYLHGNLDGRVHYFKAHQFYKKGCQLKNGYACLSAGIFYERGLGLNKSYIEHAQSYFKQGCLLKHELSCRLMR